MGVSLSRPKDDASKKINHDIELQLFRSSEAKSRRVSPYWNRNFRMILIGSDNPTISHKCSFFIKCNAVTLIRILAFEQAQSLVSISKLLTHNLSKCGLIAQSKKYQIRCVHSAQIISNLDFWQYELDATLCKLITTIWNDNGIQHTFDWYQNEIKKLRSPQTHQHNMIGDDLILDVMKEYKVYPTFCQRFLNNLKDFTVQSLIDIDQEIDKQSTILEKSLDYVCINDYCMEVKLTNYDYMVLEHSLIDYYSDNNYSYSCNYKVKDNFSHLFSLLNYPCLKEIPSCSLSIIYHNMAINRRSQHTYENDNNNINFDYVKELEQFNQYVLWSGEYASKLEMMAANEPCIRHSASNRIFFLNIDFIPNFFKIVSKLEQEQGEVDVKENQQDNDENEKILKQWKLYFGHDFSKLISEFKRENVEKILNDSEDVSDRMVNTRIMLCYNSYKIRLRQERLNLNCNTNYSDTNTDFALMYPYPCQAFKKQFKNGQEYYLSQSEKRSKIYEWETKVIGQFEHFLGEIVNCGRLYGKWRHENRAMFFYASKPNSWWKSRDDFEMPAHQFDYACVHRRQRWLKKSVARSNITKTQERENINLQFNSRVNHNHDVNKNEFDELCQLKNISKLDKQVLYDQLLDTKYDELDCTFCIVDVSNVESCLRAETRMFFKSVDVHDRFRNDWLI